MAGNSQRRGAINKSRKGPAVGTGGHRKRGLEGKGPTPKADERPNHKKYKMAKAAEKRRPQAPRKRGDDSEWAAGRNSVLELLRADVPVATLYVAEGIDRDDRVREILAIAVDRRLSILDATKPELDRFTDNAVHQGIAAKLPPYEYAHPDDLLAAAREAGETPLIVVVDSITDPRNLGAIIRSASGFGAHGVVIPERRAAGMTASAWKTSAGAAARVPVARVTNLTRQLKAYADEGLMLAGLAADGDVSLPDLDLAEGPLVLVVGSEGKGLSRLVAETCDVLVSIPMASTLESLNAGVATGIALYAIDQRRAQA
jgi:23S rRNA (guanosine2251-2'-O)-methyltransferase